MVNNKHIIKSFTLREIENKVLFCKQKLYKITILAAFCVI